MQQPAITAATAYGLGHLKTLKAIYQILEPLYAGDIIVKGNRESLRKALADLQENAAGPGASEERKRLVDAIAAEISAIPGVSVSAQ